MFFEHTYAIDSQDLDCFNLCRPSALLGYLQDAAGLAAGEYGASNDEMVREYRHCWMVTRIGYQLDRPLGWGAPLTVKTWHRGGAGPLVFREFDLLVDGAAVGQALSIWVLVDLDRHTLTRPDHFPQFVGTDGGSLIRNTKLPKLRPPADLPFVEERRFHYSDTDGNGHVNNTRYADLLCDAAGLQTQPPGTFVRDLRVDFLRECRAGEALSLHGAWAEGGFFVQGRDGDGAARFQGRAAV